MTSPSNSVAAQDPSLYPQVDLNSYRPENGGQVQGSQGTENKRGWNKSVESAAKIAVGVFAFIATLSLASNSPFIFVAGLTVGIFWKKDFEAYILNTITNVYKNNPSYVLGGLAALAIWTLPVTVAATTFLVGGVIGTMINTKASPNPINQQQGVV